MWYVGTKTNCEAYNEKVSKAMGLTGNMTSAWASVDRHPSKSLFCIIAHASITPDEGANLKLVETLTPDWNETIEP